MNGAPAIGARRPATQRSFADDVRPLLIALVVLTAWDLLGLDLPLTRLFGSADGFAWRDHWLTAGLLHTGTRNVAWLLFGLLTIGIWRPSAASAGVSRRERIWGLGTMLLCIALIPLLKRNSLTSCPWSLAEFGGGAAHYVSHWLPGQADGGSGGCFPSGHASTAFGFLAGWFVLRQSAPRAARVWLILTIVIGLALGGVQMVRGAHYASHSLWTGWICWAVSLASFHVSRRWRSSAQARSATVIRQRPDLRRRGDRGHATAQRWRIELAAARKLAAAEAAPRPIASRRWH